MTVDSKQIRILYPFSPDENLTTYFEEISSTLLNNRRLTPPLPQTDVTGRSGRRVSYAELDVEPTTAQDPPEVVYICGPCDSSFDVALTLAQEDLLPIWSSVLVTSQRAGKGQLGRRWISPPGNLYGTVRLPLSPIFSETTASSAIGAFIVHALNALGSPVFLKWPNDLLIQKSAPPQNVWAKIGGVLLKEQNGVLLAGVGINIRSAPEYERQDAIIKTATMPTGPNFAYSNKQILDLWRLLVRKIFLWHDAPYQSNGPLWHSLAERRLAFKRRQVAIKDGAKEVCQGALIGIDKTNGGACLSILGERKTFLSGSLYPLP